MAVTPAIFRQSFPEFSDPDVYSDFIVNMHITVAGMRLNDYRFGDLLDYATSLYIAHMLVIGARNTATAAAGGMPGTLQGVLTAKAVDKVSASYDSASVAENTPAFYNLTSYGTQLWELVSIMGAGGMQIGVGFGGYDGDGWLGFGGGYFG